MTNFLCMHLRSHLSLSLDFTLCLKKKGNSGHFDIYGVWNVSSWNWWFMWFQWSNCVSNISPSLRGHLWTEESLQCKDMVSWCWPNNFKVKFYEYGHFPEVIGCIDGCCVQQKTQMIQDQHFLTDFSVSLSAMFMSSFIFFMARLSSLGLNVCVSSLSLQENPFTTILWNVLLIW